MALRWWLVAVFGAWFVASAWALSAARHSPTIHWNFIIFGVLILAGGIWAALQPRMVSWRDGLLGLFGIWVAVSPWALGFAHHHGKDLLATLVVGILTLIGAGLSFTPAGQTAHGRASST